MRNFMIVLLIVGAVGYYFDISPTDFLPSLPNSEPAKERHAPAAAAPAQPTVATAPISKSPDGSLSDRWKTSPSPAKP
jgi:hypothetical protein